MCINNTHEASKSLNSFNGSLDSLVSSSRLFFMHTTHQRYTFSYKFFSIIRREENRGILKLTLVIFGAHTQTLNLHQNDARCRSIIFDRVKLPSQASISIYWLQDSYHPTLSIDDKLLNSKSFFSPSPPFFSYHNLIIIESLNFCVSSMAFPQLFNSFSRESHKSRIINKVRSTSKSLKGKKKKKKLNCWLARFDRIQILRWHF